MQALAGKGLAVFDGGGQAAVARAVAAASPPLPWFRGKCYRPAMTKVGLVFGGRTVEHEVSVASARTVARGLREAGHEVIPLGIGPDGHWLLPEVSRPALEGQAQALPPTEGDAGPQAGLDMIGRCGLEAVFPLVHGTWGEDGCLQGFCEMLDLPYVGPGVTTSAVAMDKLLCKQVLQAAGLPVVPAVSLTRHQYRDWARSPRPTAPVSPSWPCFVKPSVGGSSVGISRVDRPEDLPAALELALRFDERCLVEEAIVGRELECALIGWDKLEASRPGEIVPGNAFYDYADKYLLDGAQLIAPAPLAPELEARLASLARAAFEALGGWGMARVDFFLQEDGRFFINEINTIPGFTDISMYPRLWEISGLPLPDLVDRLVHIALQRHQERRKLDQGIKNWMAELHQA